MIQATVIVPTFGRPQKLGACVASIARQKAPGSVFELIVTIDGIDDRAAAVAQQAWEEAGTPGRLLVLSASDVQAPSGPCVARNRAIEEAQGEILIFMNDDVVAQPGCIQAHIAAQRSGVRKPFDSMVTGDAPWRIHQPDTLFARMLRETSMVFFHHRMRASSAHKREATACDVSSDVSSNVSYNTSVDWGFRHAWTLNLSVPAQCAIAVGGMRQVHRSYGRDDDEFAYRLTTQCGLGVRWCPDAVVEHDHAMTPQEYLSREYQLGLGVPRFANGASECSQAMFGRDLRSASAIQEVLDRGVALAQLARECRPWFEALGSADAAVVNDADVMAAYERHLPLKRWEWCRGFADGLNVLDKVAA